ncbi:MAG TPA: AraC family transcriptional regulator [Chryseolinea sp.]|jgi:AraC-like DNA-binding protein|nr:AraC family transcriptional regulator [Chryseolinea sp.]
MLNLQDFVANSALFKKFEVDELLFIEYKCPIDQPRSSIWWHNNFFAFVLAGETLFKTPWGQYTFKAGDCVFAKKGSIIVHSHLHEDYCELLIFVPDNFIKSVIQKYKIPVTPLPADQKGDTIIPLAVDDVLLTYFHSLLTYFRQSIPPSEILLRLKLEELVINILVNSNHLPVKNYFSEICSSVKPSIKEIMEANFFSNLSLEEFARLCARSLSGFKQEFRDIYQISPGKWLQEKRLEYSHYLLETTTENIDGICLASGFENRSHFIRVFKNKYGVTPGKLKTQKGVSSTSLLS